MQISQFSRYCTFKFKVWNTRIKVIDTGSNINMQFSQATCIDKWGNLYDNLVHQKSGWFWLRVSNSDQHNDSQINNPLTENWRKPADLFRKIKDKMPDPLKQLFLVD